VIARPLGLIRVPTPGTPVQVTANRSLRGGQILVRSVPGFTGKTYFGVAGMDKNSVNMQGVIRVLAEPGSAGAQDNEAIPPSPSMHGNSLCPADYYVDADVAGEGLLVTYLEF
jgi:hypothetical protein